MRPTAALRLLGVVFAAPLSWFFASPEQKDTSELFYIIRRGHRRLLRLTETGVRNEALSPHSAELLEVLELSLQPGGSSGTDFYSHEGEQAGLVVAGTFRPWLDDKAHILHEADSLQFPSLMPHRFDNPEQKPCQVIWVIGPRMPKKGPSNG